MRASSVYSQNGVGGPHQANLEEVAQKDRVPDFSLLACERQQTKVLPVAWETDHEWIIWQIADSAFPTGGFGHSSGLEAAWQQGEVRSSEELARFIQTNLAQVGSAAVPFVNEAFHQSRPFRELDFLCDAFLSNHVAKRASRGQGQAFLFAAAHAFPSACLATFREKLQADKLPGHFAPVFGATLRALEVRHSLCVRVFLFMSLRSLLGSAVRLGIIGPMAAQAIQAKLASEAERVAVRSVDLCVVDTVNNSPLLEILHGAHDRLYSRLFQT